MTRLVLLGVLAILLASGVARAIVAFWGMPAWMSRPLMWTLPWSAGFLLARCVDKRITWRSWTIAGAAVLLAQLGVEFVWPE